MPIRDQKIQPFFVHPQATVANMQALVGRVGVVPDLLTRERIDRPDVVRDGKVQHAIGQQRSGFDFRGLIGLKGPCQGQTPHILQRNLLEPAVALPVIGPVVLRPTVRRWMKQRGVIYSLRPKRTRKSNQRRCTRGEQECILDQLHSCSNLSSVAHWFRPA